MVPFLRKLNFNKNKLWKKDFYKRKLIEFNLLGTAISAFIFFFKIKITSKNFEEKTTTYRKGYKLRLMKISMKALFMK